MTALREAAQQKGALVSRLIMSPDHSGKPAVVVEGSKDLALFRSLLGEPSSYVLVDAGSRTTAIEVVEEVHKRDIPALAIVDSDDELVCGPSQRREAAIITTDLRDIEAMMFMSPVGDRLIADILDPAAVKRIEGERGCPLKEVIISELSVVGAARAVNYREDFRIRFKDVDVCRFLDVNRVRVDEEAYVRALVQASSRRPSFGAFNAAVAQLRESVDPSHLLPGHDLTRLLSALCRGRLGAPGAPTADSLELALRVGYSNEYFRQTNLYRRLSAWSGKRNLCLVT